MHAGNHGAGPHAAHVAGSERVGVAVDSGAPGPTSTSRGAAAGRGATGLAGRLARAWCGHVALAVAGDAGGAGGEADARGVWAAVRSFQGDQHDVAGRQVAVHDALGVKGCRQQLVGPHADGWSCAYRRSHRR